jgi:putative transcriptional regulator
MAVFHETAEDQHAAGAMDKKTMPKFDEMCLTPVLAMAPEDMHALREREVASQAVFARYSNVSTGLVSHWERGEKHPQGSSLKLLSWVARHGSFLRNIPIVTFVVEHAQRRRAHMPQKSLFDTSDRPNGLVMPACCICNKD